MLLQELIAILPADLTAFVSQIAPIAVFVVCVMNVIKQFVKKYIKDVEFCKAMIEAITYLLSILLVLGYSGVGWMSIFGGIIIGASATGAYRLVKPAK